MRLQANRVCVGQSSDSERDCSLNNTKLRHFFAQIVLEKRLLSWPPVVNLMTPGIQMTHCYITTMSRIARHYTKRDPVVNITTDYKNTDG